MTDEIPSTPLLAPCKVPGKFDNVFADQIGITNYAITLSPRITKDAPNIIRPPTPPRGSKPKYHKSLSLEAHLAPKVHETTRATGKAIDLLERLVHGIEEQETQLSGGDLTKFGVLHKKYEILEDINETLKWLVPLRDEELKKKKQCKDRLTHMERKLKGRGKREYIDEELYKERVDLYMDAKEMVKDLLEAQEDALDRMKSVAKRVGRFEDKVDDEENDEEGLEDWWIKENLKRREVGELYEEVMARFTDARYSAWKN